MEELKLEVNKRDVLGKKNRFLRRQGITPAHLFGHDVESRAIQCDTALLKRLIARAGGTRLISLTVEGEKKPKSGSIREIQKDPLGKEPFRVLFYEVKKGE